MKRKSAKSAATAGNPAAVLRAFATEAEFILTLDGFLLLEALGSAFATGTHPKLYDVVLAAIVMSDEDAVLAARHLDHALADADEPFHVLPPWRLMAGGGRACNLCRQSGLPPP